MAEDNDNKYIHVGDWLTLESGIGTAVGAATQDTGMWIAIGAVMGVVRGSC